jgi:uncharacterized membrane protein
MSSDPPREHGGGTATNGRGRRVAAGGTDLSTRSSPAVRGGRSGREAWTGAAEGGLAPLLGWFSLGLGLVEVIAPRQLARLIGVPRGSVTTTLMQVMGVRELANGVGILSNPTAKEWVGMRIGGDLLDLALLGAALAKSERPGRTLLAAAAVLGVSALDVIGTEQLAERRKAPPRKDPHEPEARVQRSITIGRPREEVFTYWRDFTNLPSFMENLISVRLLEGGRSRWRATGPGGKIVEWESELVEERHNELIAWSSVAPSDLHHSGRVRFEPAPDDGTVVTVEMQYSPPGGRIGAALLKLLRNDPGQKVADDLRRLKQVMETGEVLLSDASVRRGAHAARPPHPSELH